MIIKKYFSFFMVFILCAFTTAAQNSLASVELRSERGMFSKVFIKANGEHEAILSSSPVHYKKNNGWEEINTNIISSMGIHQNESNVIRSYFPNSISSSDKIKLVVNSTDELFIHSEKKLVTVNTSGDLKVIVDSSNTSIANVINNSINYSGIYKGISDEFTILNGAIKNNVVLNAPPALLTNVSSGYFGFQEIVELPKGWKITTLDKTVNALTSSALLISDSTGRHVLTIPAPMFFDKYGSQSDGANPVEGKYLIEHKNDSWAITTLVPVAWLKDVNTKYPVSIDPTVTLAGVNGGWQSPNNFVDNPGFVFLGVCCANLTHRAWILFNTTSIPDASCITSVEVQVNVATVVAATPELVLINDVTGAAGPYGAINPAAYNDFGNGFYNSFTINGTGIYGYYNLGATANTLLQSQLPVNWFEVAFQLNNEPSTNYKIINGTSSNLRVTYNAPPCILPVELLSFDANCNSGKVNLTWATASQKNNNYFTVERTTDGINYKPVGVITGAGNSSKTNYYAFVDEEPSERTSYYRLKQTDFNGQTEHLNLVAVNCRDVKEFAISPNPGSGIFIIDGAEQNSDVIITDVLGQIVFQTKVAGEKTGSDSYQIDLSNKLNGIYFIQMISMNGITSKKIIVKQ